LQRRTLILSLIAPVFLVVGLTACQAGEDVTIEEPAPQQVPSNEGSPTGAPQSTGNPTGAAPSASIQSMWEASPHAHTYVLDELGMNSTCARCHAPTSYIPSMDDMPDSCAVCKFEVAPPPPTIAEVDWGNIPCKVCHRLKRGEVKPEYAWLSIPPIDEYEDLATTTDLCLKCHGQIDIADHGMPDLANAHAGYTCTQCHDAHTTTATCASEICHANVLNPTSPTPGHDENHETVTCWACHDAAGLAVGPDDQGNWVTLLPDSSIPFASHNIVKQALCERCHYINNPWNLSEEVP
jgi:hypothetical protein